MHDTVLHRLVHTAAILDFFHDGSDLFFHLVGQGLDVIRAAEGIDHIGQVGLLAQNVLGVDRDARRCLGRNAQHLVVRIGVQRLEATEDSGYGLGGDARDIVERLLPRQVHARGLCVELEPPRPGVGDLELIAHDRGPDTASGAELGNLLEYADGDVEEKGETCEETLRIQAPLEAVPGILDGR